MKKIILCRKDGNATKYYQNTNLGTGMPRETTDKSLAYQFVTVETAAYYSSCFIRLGKQLGVPAPEYQLQEIDGADDREKQYTFFVSVLIEDENDDTRYLLDVCRRPYIGTFAAAQEYTKKLITGTAGVLTEAKIESMKDGIGTTSFVEEYRYPAFEHTSYYATL